jgi:hypothetical protein
LYSNTTGEQNVCVGLNTLRANTTGSYSTALGYAALDDSTTGGSNVAIGYAAMSANTTGSANVTAGYATLDSNTTGNNNVAIGYNALTSATTADVNVAVGKDAGLVITTGATNTLVGMTAGGNISTGNNNVCIGSYTGAYDGTDLTTGGQNTLIGAYNKVGAADATYTSVLGYYVTGASSTTTLGSSTTDSQLAHGGTTWTAPSDIRLKEDIQDEKVGLDFINDLRPVTFLWKKEKDVPEDMVAHGEGTEDRVMNGKYNHGFIAQEVKEVIDKYDLKEGFDMWKEDEADGRQRIGEAALMPLMVKAVQELSAKVDDLTEKLNECNCE